MSESRVKQLWKNRMSKHTISFGFHLNRSNTVSRPNPDIVLTKSNSTGHSGTKNIWRKPLPEEYTQLMSDAYDKEDTIDDYEESNQENHRQSNQGNHKQNNQEYYRRNAYLFEEKTEIPTRNESKSYDQIPYIEAQLSRACNSEKILVTLAKRRQKL
ncbi:hypothetical protein BDB01DRAFT_774432 [Pilobolus umbonatus]|nr:hypothetical protein BDB01DRAFT_774432 [Pilobolus umbonatus]